MWHKQLFLRNVSYPQTLNKEGENVSYPLSSCDKCFVPPSATGQMFRTPVQIHPAGYAG